MDNDTWDEGQMGERDGILGTIDQLLIDECIMSEVKENHRDLAVAFYDYKKAYEMVHHDFMIMVYRWMGIPEKVCKPLETLMSMWKTRLEINLKGIERQTSRLIRIARGFLKGDSYSPIGYCLTKVPVGMLIPKAKGCRMGLPGQREIKRTHSLFVDD